MNVKSLIRVVLACSFGILLVGVLEAAAAPVPIDNYSFENEPQEWISGVYTDGDIPGWTVNGSAGLLIEGPWIQTDFGDNVVYIGDGYIEQTTGRYFSTNATYSVEAYVGARTDYPFSSFDIELWAGDVKLAELDNPTNPDAGSFDQVTLAYQYDPNVGVDQNAMGSLLTIRLVGGGIGAQTIFDNVSFDNNGGQDTNPVPEPATMILFASGLLGLAGAKKRIKE